MADNNALPPIQRVEEFELKALQVLHAEFSKVRTEADKLGSAVNSYVHHLLAKLGIDNASGRNAIDLQTGHVVKTTLGTQQPIGGEPISPVEPPATPAA